MPRTKQRQLNPPASSNAGSEPIAETLDVLTLEEAALYLRVPADAVLCMIEAEGLPARRFGADWRIYKLALQAWLGAARPRKGILNHIGGIEGDPYAEEMLREIYAWRGRPQAINE
jgi:excisionase family DNA binding protein